MKEPLENNSGGVVSRQKGWYQHLANCIASEQCPYCGEALYVNVEIHDKTLRKTFFFECSACSWKNC
jgi:hypothetical protein